MEDGIVCDTNLTLAIGYYGDHLVSKRENIDDNKKCDGHLDLSSENQGGDANDYMEDDNVGGSNSMIIYDENESSKNNSDYNKGDDDKENVNNNNGGRKKLRLTREQTNFLEEKFKRSPIISMIQKQVIASKLNLKSRQVEVWFQNRRARTKLKQIEVDYEFMKKYRDSLIEENRRLKRELQEFRSLKFNHQNLPLFLQLSKASKKTPQVEN